MLVLGIAQFGLAFRNYLSITDATRVGARAAAVKRTAGACAAATHRDPEHGLGDAVGDRSPAGSPARAGANTGDQVKVTSSTRTASACPASAPRAT